MQKNKDNRKNGILSPRAALVLMLSLLVAIAAGVLTVAGGHRLPEAVMVAGVAFAAAVTFFNTIITE